MSPSEPSFEVPISELRRRIDELEAYPPGSGRSKELERLRSELSKSRSEIYKSLDRWQKTQVARHHDRPHTLDYIKALTTDWVEIPGDRAFADEIAQLVRIAAQVVQLGPRGVDVLQALAANGFAHPAYRLLHVVGLGE